ncbi:hypothetical protein SAY86_031708 [Trapa natans]|uniref:DUF1771 domain-containing protein n=1 Tax=Trapa natans TaxID=22666 RepID=A0AAN7LSB6_TRANT|nr:hypothetical protein SAY86_031708 [Trapa natans]
MNLSKKAIHPNNPPIGTPRGVTTLNPNAAEFIPFSLRSPSSGSTSNTSDAGRFASFGLSGKAIINRSEPSVSDNSDEEARQFWRHQLPDDITPDFKVEDESQSFSDLSLAGLSLLDESEATMYSASSASGYAINELQESSPHVADRSSFSNENLRYSGSFGEESAPATFLNMVSKPWDKQIGSNHQLFGGTRETALYNGNSGLGGNDVLGEHGIVNASETNPLDFLASNFPGFAADSLAEVYYANGCDLNMTTEMLTQLELQVDGPFNLNLKTTPTPNLNAMDFPALSAPENHNVLHKYSGDDLELSGNPFRSNEKDSLLFFKSGPSAPTRGTQDFVSAVKKMPSQDSGVWKYDRNGSSNSAVGSSRNPQILASTYGSSVSNGRVSYGDRLQSRASTRAPPVWLETGEAVANLYTDLREEARGHARIRNVYLEQARQAYLVGNKALAKELSVKGQLHNMHMKTAHGKAHESIYRQRYFCLSLISQSLKLNTVSPIPS